MHHRLKSQYLKSSVNARGKITQMNEKQLDAEIEENFVEDVEGETDECYDKAETYEHIPKMLKAYRVDTKDDAGADCEEDAEDLCQFMDKLDISRFVDEVENVWQKDTNDNKVQRKLAETDSVCKETLQTNAFNRRIERQSVDCSTTHKLIRPPAARRLSAVPVSFLDRPNNYLSYKLLTRKDVPAKQNEHIRTKRRVLSGILRGNQVSLTEPLENTL